MVSGTRNNPARSDAASEAASGADAPVMPVQKAENEHVRGFGAEGSPTRADTEEGRKVGSEGSPAKVAVRVVGRGGSRASSAGGRDGEKMVLGALVDITNTLQGLIGQVAEQTDSMHNLQDRMTAVERDAGSVGSDEVCMDMDLAELGGELE